jgi:hypothetical protein
VCEIVCTFPFLVVCTVASGTNTQKLNQDTLNVQKKLALHPAEAFASILSLQLEKFVVLDFLSLHCDSAYKGGQQLFAIYVIFT